MIRIANGQGFWGDWLEAPVRQVKGGPIDYLMMDYLAEVTMSIMQKQKSRDPRMGYARDFVPLMERILPDIAAKRIRVTSNAGGVNPRGCAWKVCGRVASKPGQLANSSVSSISWPWSFLHGRPMLGPARHERATGLRRSGSGAGGRCCGCCCGCG